MTASAWILQDRERRCLAELDYAYQGSPAPRTNVALAGTASAVSSTATRPVTCLNDGDRKGGPVGLLHWACNADFGTTPTQWVEITFASASVDTVVIWGLQDLVQGAPRTLEQEPNEGTVTADWGFTDYTVTYWDGAAYQTLATVTGNTNCKRTHKFTAVTTTKIRINITAGQGARARLCEVEVFTPDPVIGTFYLSDGLGSDGGPIAATVGTYRACIAELPNYSRAIDKATLSGAASNSFGRAKLNNRDGRMNWLKDAVIDGQQFRVKVGDPSWAASAYESVFTARMKRVTQDAERNLIIEFSDGSFLNDVTVSGAPVDADSNTQLAPILLGQVPCNALVKDTATNWYRFCDSAYWTTPLKETGIVAVYDGAVPLNGATVTPSAVAPSPALIYDPVSNTRIPSVASTDGSSATTNPAINLAGATLGDTILLFLYVPSTSITLSVLWYGVATFPSRSAVMGDGILYYFRLPVTSYSFTSFSVTFSAATTFDAKSIAISGTDISADDGSDETHAAAGPTVTAPTLTPSTTSDLLVTCFFSRANASPAFTPGASMTEQIEGNSTDGTTYWAMAIDTQTLASSAATGTRTSTVTNHNGSNAGISVLLKPQPSASVNTGTGTFTSNSHGILTNDVVSLSVSTGGTPPGGLTDSNTANAGRYTQYWAVNCTGNTFQLAATRGGTALTYSSAGTGTFTFTARRYWDMGDGSVKLNATPTNQVHGLVKNSKVGPNGYYTSDALRWVHYAVAKQSESTYSGAHKSFPVATADAEYLDTQPGIFIGSAVGGVGLANQIARNANAFWGYTRDCKFTFGRIRTNPLNLAVDPNGFNTAVRDLTDSDVLDGVVEDRLLPLYRYASILVAMNHPPLTSVRTDASQVLADQFRAKGVLRSMPEVTDAAYATAPWRYHVGMFDTPVMETDLPDDATYYTPWLTFFRDRLLPHIEFRSFQAPLSAYDLELGDKVTTYMPLKAGDTTSLSWQVLAIDIRLTERRVALTLVRRRAPDAVTSSH
jgi:hypothetical protein